MKGKQSKKQFDERLNRAINQSIREGLFWEEEQKAWWKDYKRRQTAYHRKVDKFVDAASRRNNKRDEKIWEQFEKEYRKTVELSWKEAKAMRKQLKKKRDRDLRKSLLLFYREVDAVDKKIKF